MGRPTERQSCSQQQGQRDNESSSRAYGIHFYRILLTVI